MNKHLIRSLSLAALLACLGASVHAQNTNTSPGSGTGSGGTSAGASGSAATAGASLRRNERNFLTRAAGDGMFEVQASQLAEQKATDPGVKSLAAMLVKDHTSANNELMQLASSKGVTLPTSLPRDKQREMDSLSKLSGATFDREFMRRVGIAAHQSDIKQFEAASRNVKDPEIKAWVDKTLPTLRDHLAQAQKTPMPGGGSAGAGGGTSGSGTGSGTGAGGSSSGGTSGGTGSVR
jgi:putative membrane protein